jgi:hypothetical protein
MTSPTRMLITPRKPWSFFLNFFWSNTCTAMILSSLTRLGNKSRQHARGQGGGHIGRKGEF